VPACSLLPQRIPAVSCIGGLAGADLTPAHFTRALEATAQALAGAQPLAPVWLNEGDR
jgi:pyruvate ferredoxin oxidoreductase alpha subunit/phenylglyoxylate dehydrogenase alpha subunit